MAIKLEEMTEDQVRAVEIVAKKWSQPNTENHYHSVRVNVLFKHHSKPVELVHVAMQEGRDRTYDRSAMEEWVKIFPQKGKARLFLSRHLEERGVKVTIFKTDVNFKKDL